MKMKGTLSNRMVIVGTALAAGAAGFWVASRHAGAPGPHRPGAGSVEAGDSDGDQRERDSTRALRAQLAGLELRVADLSSQLSAQKAGTPPHDEGSAAPSPTAEETIEHDRVVWQEHMKEVSTAFQAELHDQHWAQSQTALLQERFGGDEPMRAALKNIECRSKTCRIDLVDDRKGKFERSLPLVLQKLGAAFPRGEASTVDNPDGTRSISVYLSSSAVQDGPGPVGS
jgi:hypothetical protein